MEGIALSSVVPAAEAPWDEWAFTRKLELFDIQGNTPAPVTSRYAQPGQLGVDRLCAAVGAVGRLGSPVIVVMLGTATVIDARECQGRIPRRRDRTGRGNGPQGAARDDRGASPG